MINKNASRKESNGKRFENTNVTLMVTFLYFRNFNPFIYLNDLLSTVVLIYHEVEAKNSTKFI